MKYLWHDLDKITALLRSDCPKVLFLDFDGTLTPIAKSPQLANISKETKKLLQSLCRKPNFYLAIISGRKLNDLEQRVGLSNIIYASKHGFKGEIQNKQYNFPVKKNGLAAIRKVKEQLQEVANQFNGAFIEDKQIMLAFHFRAVADQYLKQLKLELKKILKPFEKSRLISTIPGKKVLEILPKADWNKGYFATMVMKKIEAQTKKIPVAIAIGDDQTDEDTFQKLNEHLPAASSVVSLKGQVLSPVHPRNKLRGILRQNKAITITVGEKYQSKAKYYLKDTAEVTKFLEEVRILV